MGSETVKRRESEWEWEWNPEWNPRRTRDLECGWSPERNPGRIPAFRKSGMVFGAVTALLVCAVLFSAAMTARGIGYPPRLCERRIEEEYRELERAYREELRTYLEASGYRNAGVTLTHTTDADGNRTYLVRVHHDRLCRLGEEAREALREELCAMGFEDERSEFRAEIL